MQEFYVYILASHSRRLYVGVTSDLPKRVWEHRNGFTQFTAKYHIHRLVHLETFAHATLAIRREKGLKRFLRVQKIRLIEKANPMWLDLAAGWFEPPG